jgi:hypothetical protein
MGAVGRIRLRIYRIPDTKTITSYTRTVDSTLANSSSHLRCVYLACGKSLEQRGIGRKFTSSYRVRSGKNAAKNMAIGYKNAAERGAIDQIAGTIALKSRKEAEETP